MTLYKNSAGGIEDHRKEALVRAKENDLITFPKGLAGTNCFNCQWIRDKKNGIGYCFNKHLQQYVNAHMCCNRWNREDALRAFENKT